MKKVKSGQIYELEINDHLDKFVVTSVDENDDKPACFLINSEGICSACYCNMLTKNARLIAEYNNWTDAVNTSLFNDNRVLN